MAKQIIKTVAGNTAPPLALTAERDNVIINLAGCTVTLLIWKGKTQTNVGHTSCTITSAPLGTVSYVRQAIDTAVAGTYNCDLKVTYADTTFEILYDILALKCRKPSGT